MTENISNKKQGFTGEDIVIIIAFALTLLLAVISGALWSINEPIVVPPPIIAILLGISVSSLVYRFLGGTHETKLVMKGAKVTGSGAMLVIVSMWANKELKLYIPKPKMENTPLNLEQHVLPSRDQWYAVDIETGRPVTLEFPMFQQTHEPPKNDVISAKQIERNLTLESITEEKFKVVVNNGTKLTLGTIRASDINQLGYFNEQKLKFIPYKVAKFSATQTIDINSKLPFLVQTVGFGEDFTSYQLLSRVDSSVIHESAILLRNAEIVEVDKRFYLVSVIEVNHLLPIGSYAKIYVAEIIVENV